MDKIAGRPDRLLPYIKRQQLIWLAGIWEGEGSFCKPKPSRPKEPICSIRMNDEDVIAQVSSLVGVKYHKIHTQQYKDRGWNPGYALHFKGKRAREFMHLIRPLMYSRRQAAIDYALEMADNYDKQIQEC